MDCETIGEGSSPSTHPNFMSNPYWLLAYSDDLGHWTKIYEDEAEALEHYEHAMNQDTTRSARLERCFRIREYEREQPARVV